MSEQAERQAQRLCVCKTAERKIATARVRGMKGVCRFGQITHELLENADRVQKPIS